MNNSGCFKHCTNCSSEVVCCSYFDKINAPVLNKEELQKIKEIVKNEQFYEVLGKNLFSLKLTVNNCIFYKDSRCVIYDNRPVDCRLYPFDIIRRSERYFLILYLLDCIDFDSFYCENYELDSLINDIIPWINDFTDEQNFTKMKNKRYRIIKEISK